LKRIKLSWTYLDEEQKVFLDYLPTTTEVSL
jgi:hypothetical protein